MSETETAPMSITFVSDWLTARSTTQCSLNLAKTLIKHGHTVRVICPGGEMKKAFLESGIELDIRRNMYIPVLNLLTLRSAARSLSGTKCRIIHAQSQEASVFGVGLASLCRLPSVVTVRRFDSSRRLSAPKRTRILAVSEALREFLVNESKIPKERIDVVPDGVDISEYKAVKPFSVPDQIPVIGSMGRFEPLRGFSYFIKAAKTVVEAGHRVEFLIIGTGSEEKKLRELISVLGLTEYFTFVAESVDYRKRIESMDIVVVCPIKEGFGMVALEAMACAKPVIASAVGGIYSIVKDGNTGILTPPRDSDGIAEKVISLLRNTDEAERLGENARAAVEEKFTMDIVAGKTEMVYRQAVEGQL